MKPMFSERAAHGQPTARFGTVKNSLDCGWTQMAHVKLLVLLLDMRSMNDV